MGCEAMLLWLAVAAVAPGVAWRAVWKMGMAEGESYFRGEQVEENGIAGGSGREDWSMNKKGEGRQWATDRQWRPHCVSSTVEV